MPALADAFVELLPDPVSKGKIKAAIEGEVASADTARAGQAAGSKYAQAFTASVPAAAQKLKAAQLDLTASQTRLSAASDRTAASQKALADLQVTGSATADELSAAQAKVTASFADQAAAESAVIKANRSVALSSAQLADAQAGVAAKSEAARVGLLGTTAQAEKYKAAAAGISKTVGLIAVVVAGASLKMAADFQTATTRLVTAAGESEHNIKAVSDGILQVAKDTGTSVSALTKGAYQIESAGFHGADALKVLKAAAQGAKVEQADLGSVSNALTTVMEDLHAPVGDVAKIMSQMVAAVGHGKMTMDDLAGSIHSVLPNAAALKISFPQVAGALSTMTAQGISADQAAQNLNHTIVKLAAPTLGMTKAMASYGLAASDVAKNLGKQGLTGTMDELVNAILHHMGPAGTTLRSAFNTSKQAAADANRELQNLPPAARKIAQAYGDGSLSLGKYRVALKALPADEAALLQQWKASQDGAKGFSAALRSGGQDSQTFTAALKDMLGDQTGLQVALHLTGKASEDFNANVKAIAGSTSEAGGNVKDWSQVQETFNVKLAKLRETFETLFIQLGTKLIPIFQKVVDVVSGIVSWFDKHSTAAKVLAGILGGLLVTSILRVTTAWVAANVAFVATPIGAVITSLVALAAGLYILWTRWDSIWGAIKRNPVISIIAGIVLTLTAPFTTVTIGLVALGKNWDHVFAAIKGAIKTFIVFAYNFFLNPVLTVFGAIIHGAASAFGWVPGLGGKLKSAAHAFDVFRSDVNGAIEKIKGVKRIGVAPDYPSARTTKAWLDNFIASIASPRTVTIPVKTNLIPGSNTLPQIPGLPTKGRATGGGLPEGWSTVGERGWEAIYKRGGNVEVYSNSMSKALLGTSATHLPGFASGTKLPPAYDHSWTWRSGPDVVKAIVSSVRGGIPNARAAMSALNKAMNDAFKLEGVDRTLSAAKAKLVKLKADAAQLSSDVTTNLRSQFNVATAGQDASTGFIPAGEFGFKDILSSFTTQTATVSKFRSEIAKLSSLGLDKGYLAELARNGPSGTLDTLAGLSKTQIASVSKAYTDYQSITGAAGATASSTVYSAAINATSKQVASLTKQDQALRKQISSLTTRVEQLTHHTTELVLDGRVLARAVSLQSSKSARR